ncbi:MAG: hypothetical protein QXT13_06505 [Pyrobaculum sp.]
MKRVKIKKLKGAISMEFVIVLAVVLVISALVAGIVYSQMGAQAQQLRAKVDVQGSTTGFVVNLEVYQGQVTQDPIVRYATVGSTNYLRATCQFLGGAQQPRAGQSASYLCPATLTGGTSYDVIVVLVDATGRSVTYKVSGVRIPVT